MTTQKTTGGWVMDRITHSATVTEIELMIPRMKRIRLSSPELTGLAWSPGQHLRVNVERGAMLPAILRGTIRNQLRTYTILDLDHSAGTLDLCVLVRDDDTPGCRWMRDISVGDPAAFLGPQGKLVLDDSANYHLFVGEETAQVAFAPMLAATTVDSRVYGVIEVADESDHLPMDRGDELVWRHRREASAVQSPGILEEVRRLTLPDDPGSAYIAGEAKTCVAVRQHLIRERGWPSRGSILVKPFWTPGKRGLE
jgi:NADPH-dependent ferric siderophore reductase